MPPSRDAGPTMAGDGSAWGQKQVGAGRAGDPPTPFARSDISAAAGRVKFISSFKNDGAGVKWGLCLFLNSH